MYGRQYFVTDLPSNKLTKVYYAFANINNSTGEVTLSDEWADLQFIYPTDVAPPNSTNSTLLYGNFNQLFKLKQQNRNLKVVLSIGGWPYRTNFAPGLSTSARRAKFAASSTQLIQDLGLDGIDIDWEYPETIADGENFVDTVKRCREAFDTYAAEHAEGYHFELGISAPAGPIRYNAMPIAEMDEYVDYWNLMAFDYQGPGFSNFTGHLSNLYASKKNPKATDFNTDQAIQHYKDEVSSSKKINLGLPLYGRSFANVVSGRNYGLGQAFNGSGEGTWEAGVLDYKSIPLNGTIHVDREAVASWTYDNATRQFVTFDTPAIQEKKTQYLIKEGLGGAWWWDSSSDRTDEQSLTTTVSEALGGVRALAKNPNWISFPVSKYDNIRAVAKNSTAGRY
ncbi:chitinase [Byssothecium circinans]|uniref:chitinase n=1 Tax=Byssothecium circinans TaxID=147558 RepID=A0A6A5TY86_9PLEO|nr:chitinase [Byssothecium circinans]